MYLSYPHSTHLPPASKTSCVRLFLRCLVTASTVHFIQRQESTRDFPVRSLCSVKPWILHSRSTSISGRGLTFNSSDQLELRKRKSYRLGLGKEADIEHTAGTAALLSMTPARKLRDGRYYSGGWN